MVQFTVLSDGSVTGVRVASSTNARLNPHVIGAVEQWKYGAIDLPRNTQVGFVLRRQSQARDPVRAEIALCCGLSSPDSAW